MIHKAVELGDSSLLVRQCGQARSYEYKHYVDYIY